MHNSFLVDRCDAILRRRQERRALAEEQRHKRLGEFEQRNKALLERFTSEVPAGRDAPHERLERAQDTLLAFARSLQSSAVSSAPAASLPTPSYHMPPILFHQQPSWLPPPPMVPPYWAIPPPPPYPPYPQHAPYHNYYSQQQQHQPPPPPPPPPVLPPPPPGFVHLAPSEVSSQADLGSSDAGDDVGGDSLGRASPEQTPGALDASLSVELLREQQSEEMARQEDALRIEMLKMDRLRNRHVQEQVSLLGSQGLEAVAGVDPDNLPAAVRAMLDRQQQEEARAQHFLNLELERIQALSARHPLEEVALVSSEAVIDRGISPETQRTLRRLAREEERMAALLNAAVQQSQKLQEQQARERARFRNRDF